MLSHHLTDETIQEYSAGVLSESMETLIACHLTLCPTCRQRAQLSDDIGGAVLMNEREVSSLSVSAEDIIAMDPEHMLGGAGNQAADKPNENIIAGVPRPLGRLLPSAIEDLPWKSFGPGLKQYNLSTQSRKHGAFKLMSLGPGSTMSSHTHSHRELTFIVSGSYSDGIGRFAAGDIADLSSDHHHTPHVDSDVPCVCLIATDAPVKFDGLLGKIMQPFVGI